MASKAGEPRVPMTLQKSRLKAEEKILDLDFELVNVQFNETGKYALRLTVENPLLEGSGAGVQLRVNEGAPLFTNTATTDIIEQSNLNEVYAFERNRFLFTLPKGFCKNDKNHDARLRIEALRLRGSLLKSQEKTGEGFFAIYPRTNQPRMNLFASKDEDLYSYSDIMALLRVSSDDLAMHCGRLAYTVSFHEHRPVIKEETPISSRRSPLPPAKQDEAHTLKTSSPVPFQSLGIPQQSHLVSMPQPSPQFSSAVDSHFHGVRNVKQPLSESPEPWKEDSPEVSKDLADEGLPSSLPSSPSPSPTIPRPLLSDGNLHLPSPAYSPDLDFEDTFLGVQVKEDPAEQGQPVVTSGTSNQHLAKSTKESISITLHGANNLPSTKKGQVPSPYVIVKTTSDEENKQPAQGVTHAVMQPTHAPTWEEKVTVEIEAKKAGEEDVSLIVADKDTKEILARYNIPVKYLRPFHHYHCALTLPRKKDMAGTKLYATLVRKRSIIARYAGIDYTGLEVFICGVNEALAEPEGSIIAIARIVNNVKAYQEEMMSRTSDAPPVPLTVANFPDPVMEEFDVPRVTNQGYPQVSLSKGPPEKPTWNTSYLFQGRDGATAFSDDTALVIEYFRSKPEAEGKPKPLGFSVLPLTSRVYRRLLSESSKTGVQVKNLPIQNTDLKTTSGDAPTIQLGIQLFNSERPDSFLSPSITNILPLLDPELVGKLGNIKEPWTPSKTTITSVHSEETIFIAPERKRPLTDLSVLQKDENGFPSHDAVAGILPDKDLYSRTAIPEVQDVETDTFRTAIQRMADDILSLRRHIANLETENSALRHNLAMHEDVGRVLLEDIDLDVMTRAEIVDRIMGLKQKLSSGAREMAKMKDRVQRLQNELIRKNDREKDLVMLQRAHQQQQIVLRKYQSKMAKMKALEDAVRQQEKVIERMEKMLEEKMVDRFNDAVRGKEKYPGPSDSWSKDLYATLMTENTRLREELNKTCYRSSPIILQQQALPDAFSTNSEKLSLLSKLEKAEARVHVLESQLEESARKWGREKQDYASRLLEHERGFGRSPSSFILPEVPIEEREGKGDEEKKSKQANLNSQPHIRTLYTAQ